MEFDPILPPSRVAAGRQSGLWPDRLLTDYLDEAVSANPDRVAIVECRTEAERKTTLSYRQLQRLSTRMGLGLAAAGIGAGDVVAMQLPNWWQFTALHLACLRIGAVLNPLMPIFREHELAYMLAFAQAKIAIVPHRFRGFDHPAMLRGLQSDLPSLERILVVEGSGIEALESALLIPRWEDEAGAAAVLEERRPDPNAVALLLYTSGTTGAPKAVMHSSNTVLSMVLAYVRRVELTPVDNVLMASPLAHLTGFAYGQMLPIVLGTKSVLQDVWSPEVAVRLIQDEAVTFTMGATPFLADLTYAQAIAHHDISSLRTFMSAGAPIPRVLVERASAALDVMVLSGWGMTENGAATITRRSDPPAKVFGTDGTGVDGLEIRVVDPATGAPAAPNTEGRLQARGVQQFLGYLKRPEAHDTDENGWFETGDLASMDEDGYIRISGRGKDIIIRGGENIPIVEVEEILYRHPAVQDAAIVAMPDERLGERGCVFLTLREGASMSLPELTDFLGEQKVAKPYWPERVEVIEAMPRTPSGKIQKFKLREVAQGFGAGSTL